MNKEVVMTVHLIETWIIKPEHEQSHEVLWKQFVDYMSQNRELFKGIVSMKMYKAVPGEGPATHAQTVEFGSLEDKLALERRVAKDKTCSEFGRNLARLKDPKTTSETLCESFLEYK
jgi:hypothetical protein